MTRSSPAAFSATRRITYSLRSNAIRSPRDPRRRRRTAGALPAQRAARARPAASGRPGRRASRAAAGPRRHRLLEQLLEQAAALGRAGGSRPRRRSARATAARTARAAQECVGHLDEDARPVARLGVGALGPAMLQIRERLRARARWSRAARPSSRATNATPQASCSNEGSYRPCCFTPRLHVASPAGRGRRDAG